MKTGSRLECGSALLNAIIVAGVVAGVIGILMSQTKTTDKMSRNPRIKSAMTVLETQMLSMALQPGIYQGCSAQAQNCQLNSNAVAAFQHLAHNIVGANCGVGASQPGGGGSSYPSQQQCGVKVQAASRLACLDSKNPGFNSNCSAGQFYNPVTQTFCAEIVYQGTELAMQPVCASTTVPQSVLQGDSTSCVSPTNLAGPYPKIIFRGYDSAGNAVCAPIPSCSGGNVSTPGNFITAIDKVSMQTQCRTLSPGVLSCPPGTVMANLKWYNVNTAFGFISPSANCVPRRTPADIHQVQAMTPVTVPPGKYTVPTTTVPTTTTLASSPPPTTPPPTAWNCYDGYAGGAAACNTGKIIVDDAGISGSNPGSAWIQHTPNISNGRDNLLCMCSSGTKTPISCDSSQNIEYYVCSGGSTTLPNCTYAVAVGNPNSQPGDSCGYSASIGSNGGWACRNSAGVITNTYLCP